MAKGTLIAAMGIGRAADDEFNDWYDTEHIPERQRVPGFLVCQRWIGADNPRQSVATYDLVGMTPAPTVETAFNAWYDTEHVPALARVPVIVLSSGGDLSRKVEPMHVDACLSKPLDLEKLLALIARRVGKPAAGAQNACPNAR